MRQVRARRGWQLCLAIAMTCAAMLLPAPATAATLASASSDLSRCFSSDLVIDANGRVCVMSPIYASYRGWGRLTSANSPTVCTGTTCSVHVISTVPAYSWTGSAWRYQPLTAPATVYVYPFGSGWSWVWQRTTGWRAVRSDRVVHPTGWQQPIGL